jgi:hypothetical protein
VTPSKRFIAIGIMVAVSPRVAADSPLPTTEEFYAALTTCAVGSEVDISADLLGSVASFYSGQRSKGAASFKTSTKFLELFPEDERVKVYELYTKCISQIINARGTDHATPPPLPPSPSSPVPATTTVEVLQPKWTGNGRRFDITARVVAANPSMGTPSGIVIFNVDGSDEPEDVRVQGGEAILKGEVLELGHEVRIRATYKPSHGEPFLGAKSEAKNFNVSIN